MSRVRLVLILLLLYASMACADGLHPDTVVYCDVYHDVPIATLVDDRCKHYDTVYSYDVQSRIEGLGNIWIGGKAKANSTIILAFEGSGETVSCTSDHEFYDIDKDEWVAARYLVVGDRLQCSGQSYVTISSITIDHSSRIVYAIEVKNTHTFFVTHARILTHNHIFSDGIVIAGAGIIGTIVSNVTVPGGLFLGMCVGFVIHALWIKGCQLWYQLTERVDQEEGDISLKTNGGKKKQQSSHVSSGGGCNQSGSDDPDDKKKRFTDKVANMYELFKRDGFGKKLKESCEPTNSSYDNHSKIYRVTKTMVEYGLAVGDLLYLDKFHCDHLEVFYGYGKYLIKMVLNIDGTKNMAKYLKELDDFRNILEWMK